MRPIRGRSGDQKGKTVFLSPVVARFIKNPVPLRRISRNSAHLQIVGTEAAATWRPRYGFLLNKVSLEQES